MKQLYYDVNKCLGCKSCEIACAVAHSLTGELFKALKEETLSLPRRSINPAIKIIRFPVGIAKTPNAWMPVWLQL